MVTFDWCETPEGDIKFWGLTSGRKLPFIGRVDMYRRGYKIGKGFKIAFLVFGTLQREGKG